MLRSGHQNLGLAVGITAVVGALAGVLASIGNPGNMGICGACFLRDISGSLKMFGGPGPKIFRPEVLGIIFGALAYRTISGKFEARSGTHTVTRFFFGVWMAIGSLVFLGCPFRMLQRLGGGDLNALVGLVGLVIGVGIGLFFETKRGYRVGKSAVVPPIIGWVGPLAMLIVFALFMKGGFLNGPGPGDGGKPAHAVWYYALGLTLVAGAILSATGFCVISACRQIFQKGKKRMLVAAAALVAAYAVVVAISGKFQIGFDGQPAAHADHLWNILSLMLVGITGVLVGGCPVRQIVMTGEGHGDAFVTCMGLLVGGALAHNLGLKVVAEGVENTDVWDLLEMLGCDTAQGYFIRRPAPPLELANWLRSAEWRDARWVTPLNRKGGKRA